MSIFISYTLSFFDKVKIFKSFIYGDDYKDIVLQIPFVRIIQDQDTEGHCKSQNSQLTYNALPNTFGFFVCGAGGKNSH